MKINKLHEWNISPEQAKSVQKNLRAWVSLEDQFSTIKTIARVKVISIKDEPIIKCNVNLIGYPDLKLIEKQSASIEPKFPSVNGLISFRNTEVMIEAFKKLQRKPDLIICDGEGVIDEHSFGIASHIGLLTQTPTVGLKKPSRDLSLVQSIENSRGAWLPLTAGANNMIVAGIVRVGEDIAPIQASPGHGISVNSAVKFALDCFPKEINKAAKEDVAVDINKARKASAG